MSEAQTIMDSLKFRFTLYGLFLLCGLSVFVVSYVSPELSIGSGALIALFSWRLGFRIEVRVSEPTGRSLLHSSFSLSCGSPGIQFSTALWCSHSTRHSTATLPHN